MSTVPTATTETTARPVAGNGVSHKAASTLVNSFRLVSLMQRLRYHIQAGPKSEIEEFHECCICLAKGIDFAIANNDLPKKLDEFPWLLKQVCRHRTDVYTKTVIAVLMISIKHACELGWFMPSECQQLVALADEIQNSYGSSGNIITDFKSPGSPFFLIMERYYPCVKLGHVLVSLEVKHGYTVLANDFHISKNMPHSTHQKLRLFVAQTDNNIDTSACIINPPEVSFLLNGRAVERRVNITMDSAPQLPTDVTSLLKYGTNLLQVMGNFKGHYIIIIAFMEVVPPPESPVLKDYVQCGVIESDPDSDIIEGPSRVSLNCPISCRRIKLPVKGQMCKHLQCFDFSNYVHINLRNPSWRCPHCNQPVCYTEIRLDQKMVEILKNAGSNAADVIIQADGTWKVAKENVETSEPAHEIVRDIDDPISFLNSDPIVLDLTADGDTEMELFGDDIVAKDRKPHMSSAQDQSNNNASKLASDDDLFPMFDISDVISLDPEMLDQISSSCNNTPQPHQALNTVMDQDYSNLFEIPILQHPISAQPSPVPPFSQTPSPRDRATATSAGFNRSNPSPQFSHVQASPVTPPGQYLNRTSGQRWNQTYPSQIPPTTSSQDYSTIQSRRHPIMNQSSAHVRPPQSSSMQSQQLPRVPTSQPNWSSIRSLASTYAGTKRQHPSSTTPVQSVTRTCDLLDVDLTPPDTTNWRPRMRGSLGPGSFSTALDLTIIRPTQQSQTSTRLQHGSLPGQASQFQSSLPATPYRLNHPVSLPPAAQSGVGSSPVPPASTSLTRPSGPTPPWRT